MDIDQARKLVAQIKNISNPNGMVWLIPEHGVPFEDIIMSLKLYAELVENNEKVLMEQRDMIQNLNENLEKLNEENRNLMEKNICYERDIKRLKDLILKMTTNVKTSMMDINDIENRLKNG